jgi:general secretion pathway protein M
VNWLRSYQKTATIIGLTLLLPLLLLLYFTADFWMMRQGYQAEIERLQPRIARMTGLMESEAQLNVSAGQLGSQVSNLVYPPTEDSAAVSAGLQKNIREIMTEAGLTVSNSRILPLVQEETFDRVGLNLTVSGSLDALDAALSEIAAYTPLLLIESIDIKPKRALRSKENKDQQIVIASLQLLTLRAI